MLLKHPVNFPPPVVKKLLSGKDVSERGTFLRKNTLTLLAHVPRAMGVTEVVLRVAPDGEAPLDRRFTFSTTQQGVDTYRLSLSLSPFCHGLHGALLYYEYLFLRGDEILHSDTEDNVNFQISPETGRKFRLFISENEIKTPAWLHGKTMYHIFVDRFAKGEGERRADAYYHRHWEEEIEQFGAYPGAPVRNNEFFGGTLWGILDKLDYLHALGVGVLYLSPIFKAASNHKYDTGDYGEVDPQFGGENALVALLDACKSRGMGVILDGVFNHTGSDSRYFNKEGHYASLGAYQSQTSPFFDWYHFKKHPDDYECWWGIPILPKLNLSNPAVHNYFVGEGGIVEKYTRLGVNGWRLDVVDELPDAFLDALHQRVRACSDGAGVLIGEVWENAADKIAYGRRRRYFRGGQLDGVMNYPLRRGIISFVHDGDAHALACILRELWSTYPAAVCHSLMNVLSTHDTERILTVLGGAPDDGSRTNAQLCTARLSPDERALAKQRLKMAAALQFTVFGVPSIFYGDEAGLEGYHDPFCRRPYPWGREDADLLTFYRKLGKIRKENSVLANGDFRIVKETSAALVFARRSEKGELIVAANRGNTPLQLALPKEAKELLSGKKMGGRVSILPNEVKIWRV